MNNDEERFKKYLNINSRVVIKALNLISTCDMVLDGKEFKQNILLFTPQMQLLRVLLLQKALDKHIPYLLSRLKHEKIIEIYKEADCLSDILKKTFKPDISIEMNIDLNKEE